MLGPLPRLHRLVIIAIALAASVAFGVWLGLEPHLPVLVSSGAGLGVLLGAGMAWLLVHEHHESSRPHAIHVRHRHR